MKYIMLLILVLMLGCTSSKKTEVHLDENGTPQESPPLATTHPSGSLCNALHIKSPIVYPNVPIGTSEQMVVKIYIEKLHEVSNLTATGLYDPLSFYGSGFPGVFPENTFRPCNGSLSSADEAANYCHFRLNFKPHQRQTFRRQLNITYNINGYNCSRMIDVMATGF